MQESELRILFDSGDLKTAAIVNVPMSRDWCLQFTRKNGQEVLLDSQRVTPRRFKTLDAAFSSALSLGFRQAKVVAA